MYPLRKKGSGGQQTNPVLVGETATKAVLAARMGNLLGDSTGSEDLPSLK